MKQQFTGVPLIVALVLGARLVHAQDVPPPPPPKKDDGPSIEDTMKFIEEKLTSVGKLNFIVYIHDNKAGSDWTNSRTIEIDKVYASPAFCRLDYHISAVRDGESLTNGDSSFHLKTVQEIDVLPFEQWAKEGDAKAGHPEWTSRVDPPIFLVNVQLKTGGQQFFFPKEALANRVAAALNHAVELCGGGSKEPF
ncbi:MAG: hypothetical protein WBW33_06400 [Bryobacteraceae bacterium]